MVFKRFFILAAILVLMLLRPNYADRAGIRNLGVLFAVFILRPGRHVFAAGANDFVLVFVSLELITITFYILTSFSTPPAGIARSRGEISHS